MPTVPATKGEVVVIESGAGLIVIDNNLVAVRAALSVTRTVKLKLPAAVGVPLIDPVANSVSPPGKDPESMDQE